MKEVATTCPYCGVGCGVLATTDGTQIISVRGDPNHPANFGKLCSKGSALHLTARPDDRLTAPQVRPTKAAPLESVSWDSALDFAVNQFVEIINTCGADSVAFYGSGQLLTEDYYALNKLARAVVGTNNLDTNSRLCMSSTVAGYKATLGADAVPTCYEDVDHADLVFIAGSNTAWAHPVLYRRLESSVKKPRVIVIDPRRTETAAQADLHLPILPGTDVPLFHAMLHWLIWEEHIDRPFIDAHTEGFAELRQLVREASPSVVARICGVPEKDIITAAQWWAESGNVLSLYCQGLNQSVSGTAKNTALIALHLATKQIGRAGAGPFSLTGQPNAMGGREVGALANLLPGHREASNADHRDEVARLWGIPTIPETPGKTAVEMFDALERGEIKAIWIACTNPAHSMPDLTRIHAALRKAQCVVVQEAFASSETIAFADVVLPATTWGEKSGTVTNSERRITRVTAALPPLGDSKPDWEIFCAAGLRFEKALHPQRASVMQFPNPQALWEEHRAMTAGRDLDITGLSYEILASDGPQQWPYTTASTARLYTDFKFSTANGKAKFVATPYRATADKTSNAYPFALTTGRMRDHWHSMTRTGRNAHAFGHESAPQVWMHKDDMTRRAIPADAWVRVRSARGSIVVKVLAHESLRSGQVYLPMHWGQSFLVGQHNLGINTLMPAAFCPSSKQPELKHAAVKIEVVKISWSCASFVSIPAAQIEAMRGKFLQHASALTAAYAIPIAGEASGIWFEAVAETPPDAAWHATLDAVIGDGETANLEYADSNRIDARKLWLQDDALVAARLTGAPYASESAQWLREMMLTGLPIARVRKWLLAPRPPAAMIVASSPIVCACFGVKRSAISETLAAIDGAPQARLATLQTKLQCGTNCGSCLPELKRSVTEIPFTKIMAVMQ